MTQIGLVTTIKICEYSLYQYNPRSISKLLLCQTELKF